MRLILQHPQQWAVPVAGAVLRGASHPEPEVAEITFNFWFVLSNEVAGSGKMLTEAQRTECKQLFAPLFLQLVGALRHLVACPEDSDTWNADAQDDFKRFRYQVGDAINDSCQVATSAAVIEQLMVSLQAALPAFNANPQAHWRQIEAHVFCLRQSGTREQNFYSAQRVGELLQLLPSLPNVGELTTTSIRTVGTHSDWLNKNPALLPQLLGFVSHGLTQEKTAAASSQAMKHLCEKCAEHLAEEATMAQLLQMYLGTLQLQLHTADRVDLIAALAFVVSQLPLHQVLPAMQAIAQPLLTRLRELLQNGGGVGDVGQILDQVRRPSAAGHATSPPRHPLAPPPALGCPPSAAPRQGRTPRPESTPHLTAALVLAARSSARSSARSRRRTRPPRTRPASRTRRTRRSRCSSRSGTCSMPSSRVMAAARSAWRS